MLLYCTGVYNEWASYQIRKIAYCACAGNVFPRRRLQRKPLVRDAGMHHVTCVMRHARAVMHVGFAYPRWRRKLSRRMRTRNFTYLVRGRPMEHWEHDYIMPWTHSPHYWYKQRFLTPGHQGWNDLHRLCHIGPCIYRPFVFRFSIS